MEHKEQRLQKVDPDPDCEFCKSNENIWEFIGTAIVICLKDREDRHVASLQELHRVGLCQIATYYRPERDKRGFLTGCWDSTSQVCSFALGDGHETFLSLEDDFEFDLSKSARQIAYEIKAAMASLPSEKWMRLSLGHVSWFKMHYTWNLDRAMSVLTHAQIWSRRGMEWMIANNPESRSDFSKQSGIHVDGWISVACKNNYSIKPMVAYQKNLISDRTENCPFCQQPHMDASEWYVPLVWTIAFLLFAIALFVVFWKMGRPAFGFFIIVLLTVVPFLVLWGLILTDCV